MATIRMAKKESEMCIGAITIKMANIKYLRTNNHFSCMTTSYIINLRVARHTRVPLQLKHKT